MANKGKKPRIRENVETGERTVEVRMEDMVDLSIPQADEDGVIPQYVNISSQIQIITIHNNPNASIIVPVMHLLKGAQHREPYTKEAPAWGRFPYFLERPKVALRDEDGEKVKKNGKQVMGHDRVYVLTEEQALHQINSFGVRETVKKRVHNILDNAKFIYADGKVAVDAETGRDMREEEDRSSVIRAAHDILRKIDEMIAKRDIIS